VTSAEQQFTEFATLAAPRLRRTAFLLCGDWHTAEDLTQTALARVFVSWHRISRQDAVQAYATRTLVNSYLALRRRKRATELLPGRLPDRAVPAPAPELRLVVLDALAALPPKARAVVVLRYWEDLSVEQVAALLGCSAGNVKSQSARGLDKLRALLADTAPTPGPAGPAGPGPAPRRRPAQSPPAQTRGAPHG
jgi:RNA polymerase sigma-70 factor (sigma-E family)